MNSGLFINYLFGIFAMTIKSQSITGYFLSLYQRKETNPLLSWQVSIQRILSMGQSGEYQGQRINRDVVQGEQHEKDGVVDVIVMILVLKSSF